MRGLGPCRWRGAGWGCMWVFWWATYFNVLNSDGFSLFLVDPSSYLVYPGTPVRGGGSLEAMRKKTLQARLFNKGLLFTLFKKKKVFLPSNIFRIGLSWAVPSTDFYRTDSSKAKKKSQKAGWSRVFPSVHAITVKNFLFCMNYGKQSCSVQSHFTCAINKARYRSKMIRRVKSSRKESSSPSNGAYLNICYWSFSTEQKHDHFIPDQILSFSAEKIQFDI